MKANLKIVAACCLMLLSMAGGCRRHIEPPLPAAVYAIRLQREDVATETRFTATVRERQRIELSFKVPGTIVAMLQVPGVDGKPRELHEGDEVEADLRSPLAQLDVSDYQRRVAASRDRLAQAQAKQRAIEATLTAVRSNYDRIKALRERGSVAQQAYDDMLARRDATQAELDGTIREVSGAEVALQQAEDDLKNCALRLPIAKATISRKYVEVGERVPAGQPIFQVMDLSTVRVAFGVPDTKVNHFSEGQTLTVMADAFPGKQFTGRVSKIQPAADPRTRSFEIEVTIDQPDGLRPGMVVTLLTGRQRELVLLPMTAIGRGATPDETTVFAVVEENGRKIARKRRVQLDGVYDNRIRLVEGRASEVGEGDLVVTTGAFRLYDGQEVRLIDGSQPVLPKSL